MLAFLPTPLPAFPSLSPQVCGCGLAQSGFFFKNQEYICTRDYQQLYGTRCDSCRDFITGEVISALGRTYHPKCFVCSLCRSVAGLWGRGLSARAPRKGGRGLSQADLGLTQLCARHTDS